MGMGPRATRIGLFRMLALAVCLGVYAADSRDGLVVWYAFEEGAGDVVRDLSGNGHDARLVNTPVWTSGRNGLAMGFDGKGAHLDCGNDEALRLTRNFTVAFWVKADAQPGWYATAMSWAKSVEKRMIGWALYVGLPCAPGVQPRFYWYDPLWILLGDGPGMQTNEWQHVTVTFDEDCRGVFYVNGIPHKRDRAPRPLTSHDGHLILGGLGRGVEYHFRGAMDDFRLYRRALSAGDVRDLYEAGAAGIASPGEFSLRDEVSLQPVALDYGVLQWGENHVEVSCALPAALRSSGAELSLVLSRDSEEISRQSLTVSDTGAAVLHVPEIEPGLYTLGTRVQLRDGRVLKELGQPVTVCRRLCRGESEAGTIRRGDVWIFDEFDKLAPAAAVGATRKAHAWFLERYSFGNRDPAGKALASDGLTHILRYPLPLSGRYAVFLGLLSPGRGVQAGISEKESILTTCAPERPVPAGASVVDETFLQYAALSGRQVLTLNAPSSMTPNGLAYVKFLRLTERQVQIVEGQDDIANDKKVIFYNDGEMFIFRNWLSAQSIAEDVTKYRREMDRLDMFSVTAGASVMYYPTRVGTEVGPYPRQTATFAANVAQVERLRRFMAAGNDPLALASEAARRNGVKLEVNLRMAWHYPDGHPWNSRFRNAHPELRLLARPTASRDHVLDYFHPEVREERFRLFEEIVSRYEIDAICADFTRWPRLFGIAGAASFTKQFGRPPRFHDPDDREWFRYRAGFMTDWVRRVHRMLAAHQRRTGRRVKFRAILTSRQFLRQGLDVETWVWEGLVDALIPGTDYVNYEASDVDVETFVEMTKGTSCKVYVRLDLYMASNPSENQVKRVLWQCFKRGADGVYLYNMAPFRSAELYRNLERWAAFEDTDKCPLIPIRRHAMPVREAGP